MAAFHIRTDMIFALVKTGESPIVYYIMSEMAERKLICMVEIKAGKNTFEAMSEDVLFVRLSEVLDSAVLVLSSSHGACAHAPHAHTCTHTNI